MNIQKAKIAVKSNAATIITGAVPFTNDGCMKAECKEICDLLDALALIKEEASKNNAPLGRSDTIAMDRIRIILKDIEI